MPIVVDAVDETNQAMGEDQVFSRVAQSDTETVPSVLVCPATRAVFKCLDAVNLME